MRTKKLAVLFISLLISLLLVAAAQAGEARGEIPARVPKGHWSCREVTELAAKYGSLKKLPDAEIVEKKELAASLLETLDKAQSKCEREGAEAVPREDLDRLAVLYEALKDELAQYEGYETRREAIEKMLAKPEVPGFEYKVGANGFLRGEGVGNFRLTDFSYAPGHGEGRFLYRVKPYGYWHPADWLDIHVEGQGYGFTGGSHQEHNQISLYQGFVEAKLPGSDLLSLKGGRQEFAYGSTFILGSNSFYDGLAFDAARLRVRPTDALTVDFLWGTYASPFDTGLGGDLAGAYATYTLAEGTAIEAYVFRDGGDTARHAGESLDIFGLRGTARIGTLSLEVEPVYESGRRFNATTGLNDGINAYGGHLDLTGEGALLDHHTKFLAGFAYGSGSGGAASGSNMGREFRNPNNDTPIVGDMNVVADMSGVTVGGHHASGLQVYTLGWGIDVTKEVNFSVTGHQFVANAVEPGFSRNLGLETDFNLTWSLSENLSLIFAYDRFFTGGFFHDATGNRKDIDYGYLMLQFDLSHVKPKVRPPKG